MPTIFCELCTAFLSEWRGNGFDDGIPPAQNPHATRWMTFTTGSVERDRLPRELEQEQITVFKHQEIGITQRNAANQSCSLCAAITSVTRKSQIPSEYLILFQVNGKEFHILTGESSQGSFRDIESSFLLRDDQFSEIVDVPVTIRQGSKIIARGKREIIPSRDDVGAISSHARSMIEFCVHNHSCDHEPPSYFLPTRLIDIGTLADPVLRLVLREDILPDKYATLSYCWGKGDENHFLLKDRVEDYKIGIAINILPKTIADTVLLVRHLGIRFLWIDSLCIIQRDPEDWKREAGTMRMVYQSAFVCISALKAPHSSYGLFEPSMYNVRIPIPGEDSTSFLQAKRPAGSAGAFTEAYGSSVLATRGWTLQERLLSPRILHVGHDEVFLECRQYSLSERGWIWNRPGSCGTFLNLSEFAQVSNNKLSRSELLKVWDMLLIDYCLRKFSYETDRFIAFQGLSDLFQQLFQCQYIFGLWEHDFYNGLTWFNSLGDTFYATIIGCSVINLSSPSGDRGVPIRTDIPWEEPDEPENDERQLDTKTSIKIDEEALSAMRKSYAFCEIKPSWSWAASHHPINFCRLGRGKIVHHEQKTVPRWKLHVLQVIFVTISGLSRPCLVVRGTIARVGVRRSRRMPHIEYYIKRHKRLVCVRIEGSSNIFLDGISEPEDFDSWAIIVYQSGFSKFFGKRSHLTVLLLKEVPTFESERLAAGIKDSHIFERIGMGFVMEEQESLLELEPPTPGHSTVYIV